jgi:pimeloyl-ACP methyl ester carboxylesterase
MTRRWLRALPQAELIALPGLGQLPHVTDPDRIAALILEQAAQITSHS